MRLASNEKAGIVCVVAGLQTGRLSLCVLPPNKQLKPVLGQRPEKRSLDKYVYLLVL